jgi:hypothetical protein
VDFGIAEAEVLYERYVVMSEIKLENGQWYRDASGVILYCLGHYPNSDTFLCLDKDHFELLNYAEGGEFLSDYGGNGNSRYYIIEHLPDCTGFDWVPAPKLQLREGAWYERKDGKIVGPCEPYKNPSWAPEAKWEVCGRWYSDGGKNPAPETNLVREVEPPPPKYRPFKDAEEFKPFRDSWLMSTGTDAITGGFERVISYDDHRVYVTIGECTYWWSYKNAMERFTFDDGSPFGVIDQ